MKRYPFGVCSVWCALLSCIRYGIFLDIRFKHQGFRMLPGGNGNPSNILAFGPLSAVSTESLLDCHLGFTSLASSILLNSNMDPSMLLSINIDPSIPLTFSAF